MLLEHFNIFHCPEIGNNAGIGTDRLEFLADARRPGGSHPPEKSQPPPKGRCSLRRAGVSGAADEAHSGSLV